MRCCNATDHQLGADVSCYPRPVRVYALVWVMHDRLTCCPTILKMEKDYSQRSHRGKRLTFQDKKVLFYVILEGPTPDLAYVVRHGQTLAPVARGCQASNKKGRWGSGPQPTR